MAEVTLRLEAVAIILFTLLGTSDSYSLFHSRRGNDPNAIFFDGNIYTVNPADPEWDKHPQQAMVINRNTGKIVFVGTNDEAFEKYENGNNAMYNLEGGTILPGFHDVHLHPLEAMSSMGGECLVEGDKGPEHLKAIIAKCNPHDNGDSWILGHGHSIEPMLHHIYEGGRPPREIIDEVIPHNPVIIMEETSHSVWVNSEALRRAHITDNTADPIGGIIMRDPNTHRPNGILLENAGNMMMDVAMESFIDLQEQQYKSLINALDEIRQNGITSICDARTYWKRYHHLAWKKACDEGLLTVRTNLGLWAYPNMDDTEQIRSLKELHTADYSDKCFLRVNEIKLYADGLLETTTASMLEPYLKNLHLPGLEDNIGMNYFTQSRVEKYLNALQSFDDGKQFTFHIHAIGDRGVQQILNALEKTGPSTSRHRMTHLHIVNELDIHRFKDLGVVADFQVTNTYIPGVEEAVGTARAEKYIPVHDAEKSGAIVTLSSDWDVSRLNPLEAIQEAVTRDRQSVCVKSAIEMKTINSAKAMRHEKTVGYLGVGMDADFIILDQDILSIDVETIQNSQILLTALQGEVVYQKNTNYPKQEWKK